MIGAFDPKRAYSCATFLRRRTWVAVLLAKRLNFNQKMHNQIKILLIASSSISKLISVSKHLSGTDMRQKRLNVSKPGIGEILL